MKHSFFNIRLDVLSRAEALEQCRKYLTGARCHTVCFLNAHCFNIAQRDADYAEVINQADLLLNDGIGVKLASRLAGIKVQDNLNGTDLIPEILRQAAAQDAPVFLLGGKDGIAEDAAANIRSRLPGLRVVGTRSGFFTAEEEPEVAEAITRSGARLLILGMGVPRQELWAARNTERLGAVRLVVSGGAILDFLSGTIPRAPAWMRRLNLEWLFRLCLEPGRMWRRYILGSFVLLGHIVRLSFSARPA